MLRTYILIGGIIMGVLQIFANSIEEDDKDIIVDPIFTEICWGRELYCSICCLNNCDSAYQLPDAYCSSIVDTVKGWMQNVVYVDTIGCCLNKELSLQDINIRIVWLYGSESDIKALDSAEVNSFYQREFSSMHYWVCRYASPKFTHDNYIWNIPFRVIPSHHHE